MPRKPFGFRNAREGVPSGASDQLDSKRSGTKPGRFTGQRPFMWGGWGSNPRPKDYESSALTD